MKLNNIAFTLLMLFFPGLIYAQESNNNLKENNTIDSILNNPFFSDSKLDLELKNYWKYLKQDASSPEGVHSGWGQGLSLDYKSGYFDDFIGFDATYYGAMKLGASDYFSSRGVLYNKGHNGKQKAAGFSKVGQRYVKMKMDLGGARFDARGGWQILRYYGVLSTSTRLSPTTYLGWTGGVRYEGFTLRGAYVNSSMDRNSPDKKRLQTNDGKYINHIATEDISYKNDKLSLQYAYGESDHYLRRNILFMNIKPIKQLNFGSQIYITKALNDYKIMTANNRNFDNSASHYAFDVKWQDNNWSTKWGLAYTRAKKHNAEGFFPRHMSKNSRGTFTSMTYAGEDYMRDGELAISMISDYRLTPDLTAGLTANAGQFNYKGNHVKTGEVNVFGRWTPTNYGLKNLSVWLMFGPGWSYKNNNKTPVLTDGRYSLSHSLSSELIIDYKFNIF